VEGDDDGFAGSDALAIDADVVGSRDARAHVEARAAIDFHAADLDELVALAARAHAAESKEFVEAESFLHEPCVRENAREVRGPHTLRQMKPSGGISLRVSSWAGRPGSDRLSSRRAP
jgi:hypothetical protein